MALWLNLADALTFLGLAGAVLGVASAVVAAIAFAIIGAPDTGVAAVTGWVCCLALSLCSGIAGHWHLPGLAVVALPGALILASVVGLLRAVFRPRRTRA